MHWSGLGNSTAVATPYPRMAPGPDVDFPGVAPSITRVPATWSEPTVDAAKGEEWESISGEGRRYAGQRRTGR
jgi:hypothetical protein